MFDLCSFNISKLRREYSHILFSHFLYFWGQHCIKLEISSWPEKERPLVRGKKSKTKEEKWNCRVKCTVLIQKPTFTEDQDTMRTKISCFSHLSQFILKAVHLLPLDAADYLKSWCCLTLEAHFVLLCNIYLVNKHL